MSHTKHRNNFLMLQICSTFGNKTLDSDSYKQKNHLTRFVKCNLIT